MRIKLIGISRCAVRQIKLQAAKIDRAAVAGKWLRIALTLGFGGVLNVEHALLHRNRQIELGISMPLVATRSNARPP